MGHVFSNIKKITGSSLLMVVCVGLLGPTFATFLSSSVVGASGDPNTYPWPESSVYCSFYPYNVTPTQCSDYDFGLINCPTGDTYCGTTLNYYYQYDNYGYQFANCTSYVAQKIAQEFNGRNISGWGNASNWNTAALDAGYSDDSTSSPEVGDIAVWPNAAGGIGHVAYVASVNGSVATFDEYNEAGTGIYTNSNTSNGSEGVPNYYIHMGSPSGGSGENHSSQIIGVQKDIFDGTQQLYTATDSDIWQSWWPNSSGGISTDHLINISQDNIVGFSEIDVGSEQELYTATSDGIWETNWGNGQGPQSSNIISNLSGVKKIYARTEDDNGVTTFQLYVMTNQGVTQYWWNANSDGIQSGTIYSVSNPVDFTFGTSPSGEDEIFTATQGAVEESSFADGVITDRQIISISQNNITAVSKTNDSSGDEILGTATSVGEWDSEWNNSGGPTYNYEVNNFSGTVAIARWIDSGGTNQLFLASPSKVQEYWWNSSGSGGGTLISISQNDISSISYDMDGGTYQLYTGAGNIGWETWWPNSGGGISSDQIINTQTQINDGND